MYTGEKTAKWRSWRFNFELCFSIPNERADSVDEHPKRSHIMHERTHKGRQLEVSLPSPRAVTGVCISLLASSTSVHQMAIGLVYCVVWKGFGLRVCSASTLFFFEVPRLCFKKSQVGVKNPKLIKK